VALTTYQVLAMNDWLLDFKPNIATDDELRIAARLGRPIGKGMDDCDGKCETWTMYEHAGKMYVVPDRLIGLPARATDSREGT